MTSDGFVFYNHVFDSSTVQKLCFFANFFLITFRLLIFSGGVKKLFQNSLPDMIYTRASKSYRFFSNKRSLYKIKVLHSKSN